MPEAFDLIKKMLTVDPAKRINIKDIMAHAWLAQDSSQTKEHVLDLKIVEGMRRFSKMDPLQRIASKIVAVTFVILSLGAVLLEGRSCSRDQPIHPNQFTCLWPMHVPAGYRRTRLKLCVQPSCKLIETTLALFPLKSFRRRWGPPWENHKTSKTCSRRSIWTARAQFRSYCQAFFFFYFSLNREHTCECWACSTGDRCARCDVAVDLV